MRRWIPLFFVMLTASSLQQRIVTFDEPIDALSIQLPHNNAEVSIQLEDGWHQFTIEKEFDPALMESDLVLFPEAVNNVVLKGNVHEVELHPITVSSKPVSYEVAAKTFYRTPRILSRGQWGANHEWLFAGPPTDRSDVAETDRRSVSTPNGTSNRVDDCNAAQKNHPADFRTNGTITHDNGKRLRWAQRQHDDVKLLVVHHAAQKVSGDDRSGVERVRALYEYHANSRGWGDIGYHYVIDEEGAIYEGRAGGKDVVGGHVYCGNVGTKGIVLLGDFNKEQPTLQQVQSLQYLLDYLADLHNIDVNRNVRFKGKLMKPIVRHKDLISTECPGYYLSNVISQVISNVQKGNLLAGVRFPTIAKRGRSDKTSTRLSTRKAQTTPQLSRTFYRAKRQMRTAERQQSKKLTTQ